MRIQTMAACAAALMTAGLTTPALAQATAQPGEPNGYGYTPKFYLEGAYSALIFSENDVVLNMLGGRAGAELTSFLSIEGEVFTGIGSDDVDISAEDQAELDDLAQALIGIGALEPGTTISADEEVSVDLNAAAFAVLRSPDYSGFQGFVRAGAGYLSGEDELSVTISDPTTTETAVETLDLDAPFASVGGGVKFNINPRFGLRGDVNYNYYFDDADDDEIELEDSISAGASAFVRF